MDDFAAMTKWKKAIAALAAKDLKEFRPESKFVGSVTEGKIKLLPKTAFYMETFRNPKKK